MEKIIIYTDGACSGNPGPGGWGAILKFKDKEKTINGGLKNTTNNIMEMTAVIEALKLIKKPCIYDVEIYSDSAYVVNAINKKWIEKWEKNNWKTSNKEEVKNKELWIEMKKLINEVNAKIYKVEGHSDDELNNRCDELAKEGIEKA